MTAPVVLLHATRPSASATGWAPLAVVVGGLLAAAGIVRARASDADAVLAMGAAGVAAALVLALRDPADSLLAPLPVSRSTRRLLRVAIVAATALPAWLVVGAVLPGPGHGVAPLLALSASGVAAATWLPVERGLLPAAGLPLVWATAARLLDGASGPLGAAAGLWVDHPWPVCAVGVALVALGRHR